MSLGGFESYPIKCWDCNSSITNLHDKSCPKWIAGAAVPVSDEEMQLIKCGRVFDKPFSMTVHRCDVGYGELAKPLLPTDAKERKKIPLYSGLVKYFPDALIAVAALSQIGSDQHHPGQPLHWERGKSTDHEDTLLRHLFEAGTVDTDGVRHSTKVAWRSLARLQLELEAAKEGR